MRRMALRSGTISHDFGRLGFRILVFHLHDPAIGPVVAGGRPRVRWMLVDGKVVIEDDQLPGVDIAELAVRSREAVAKLAA